MSTGPATGQGKQAAQATRLAVIRARMASATPGPWFVDYAGDFGDKHAIIADVLRERYGNNALSFGEDHDTARFVAAARTDVEWLLDLVEDLQRQVGVDQGRSHESGEAGCYLSPGQGPCRCARLAVVGDRRPEKPEET